VVTTADRRCARLVDIELDECKRLLSSHHVGRIAFDRGDEGLVVLPVNYVFANDVVVFASSGNWVGEALAADGVAFEIDAAHDLEHLGWSVLVVGSVEPCETSAEMRPAVAPWCGFDEHTRFLTVRPRRITGRRIVVTAARTDA
jgi:nitroimidazol reductase NimA-like FMN-containing flavoprotein (pyridoxamine 5'-phosphate oxidase superfamily)